MILFSDIIETSAINGDGLTDCMEWLANHLVSSSSPARKVTSQTTPKLPIDSSPNHCDKNIDPKDKSTHRAYCTRAYSAFKCFFIRPSVPPDIADWILQFILLNSSSDTNGRLIPVCVCVRVYNGLPALRHCKWATEGRSSYEAWPRRVTLQVLKIYFD